MPAFRHAGDRSPPAIAQNPPTSSRTDFTAVLAAGDSLAVGAALGLERLGYRVPSDVSIVGMDDLPQAAFHTPPLTTMHIPMREIGAAALDLLIDDLGGLPMPPRRVELACRLILRQSTSAPRAK